MHWIWEPSRTMTQQDAPILAHLYDGKTARRHHVEVTPGEAGLAIRDEMGAVELVPRALIRRGQHLGGALALQRSDLPGWRLLIADPGAQPWLAGYERADSLIGWARRTGWFKVIGGTVVAVAAATAIALNFVDIGVRLLPQSLTRSLGEQIALQIADGELCRSAPANAALDDLARRLYPGGLGLADPLSVRVAAGPMENAFATPGGVVVLFEGLIENARSPDEVAAVIAHEFGHVHHRHPERMLVRAFGVSLLLSGAGGDIGAMADTMMLLSTSRRYERQADDQAFAALERLNLSPAGFAAFFERVAAQDDESSSEKSDGDGKIKQALRWLSGYLSTHPDIKARAAAARSRVVVDQVYDPAFSPPEWAAIKAMCQPA